MITKVEYVMNAEQTRDHACHWPGCITQVPPAMWGCRVHWFTLPKEIRDALWLAYEPGQEIDMQVSKEYLDAAQWAQDWIAKFEA